MMVMSEEHTDLEYDNIKIRFMTMEPNGLLLALRDDLTNERRKDSLEVALSRGMALVTVSMAGYETVVTAGAGLDDNYWHNLEIVRLVEGERVG